MKKPKAGFGIQYRPILQRDIEEAQAKTTSGRQAANYLGINYETYTKYAKMYGIFDRHKSKGGTYVARTNVNQNLAILQEIFDGKHPYYNHNKLRDRLFQAGYLLEECVICGFKEKRVADQRSPLLLICIDGDNHNLKRENLEIRCFNHVFLTTKKAVFYSEKTGTLNPLPHTVDSTKLVENAGMTPEELEQLQNDLMKDDL